MKPWEIEQAQKRAKDELSNLEDVNPMTEHEKKKKRMRKYRNWYEGRKEVD